MTQRRLAVALTLAALAATPALAQERQPADAEPDTPVWRPQDLMAARPQMDPAPADVARLARGVADSLVIVKYVWDAEARRQELEGIGAVIGEDGLVAAPLSLVPTVLPDAQVKEFQILIPRPDGDPTEIDAELVARDERTNLVFIRPKKNGDSTTQPTTGPALAEAATRAADPDSDADMPAAAAVAYELKPVEMADGRPEVGDYVLSVGRLSESGGYQSYVNVSRVSANLRGPTPLVAVSRPLTGPGSVVVDTSGRVLGFVEVVDQRNPPFLTGRSALDLVSSGPNAFVPIGFYEASLGDVPTEGDPKIPDLGVERLTGLSKELREYYELGDTPAIQVGDVIDGGAAEAAGFNEGDVIVAVDGEPLERGDEADELPRILDRTLNRMDVGDEVTFTLLSPSRERREVTATLKERPAQVRQAERWYAEDLGFSVRELVFADRYARNLPQDTPGVAVAFVREQSNAAAAQMRPNDLVRKVNQTVVEDLEQFKTAYQEFREASPSEPVVLEVQRGSETNILRIEVPQ